MLGVLCLNGRMGSIKQYIHNLFAETMFRNFIVNKSDIQPFKPFELATVKWIIITTGSLGFAFLKKQFPPSKTISVSKCTLSATQKPN